VATQIYIFINEALAQLLVFCGTTGQFTPLWKPPSLCTIVW